MKLKIKTTALLLSLFFSAFSVVNAQEVVELKLPKSNQVILKFMFRNGSMSDPAGKDGLTALTANTITEGGTSTMTALQIKDKIYPWAAYYRSSVDKEVSVFTFAVPTDFINDFYPIISGLMYTPSFTDEDFNRVKSNQQNYVDQIIRSSSDEEYSKKALEEFLFRGTNFSHMIEGTSAGVQSSTLDDVKKHYKNFFGANNLTIGIAGNYSAEFLEKVKADAKKNLANTTPLPIPGKANVPDGIRVEIISKDNALGSAVFMGFPLAVTRGNDDFAALMVANSWLGEHRKSYSHLYHKIRAQRSMNYGDYSYIEWYDNGGRNMLPATGVPRSSNYFSIWLRPVQTAKGLKGQYPELADLKIGHAHFALRMALREMDMITKNGMPKADFDLTRQFLQSYIKLYAQTPEKQLGFLMDSKFYGRKDYLKELDLLLAKVTLEDVNAAMKKYWQIENMFITIVTDKTEADELSKSLKANTVSPMSYSNTLKAGMPKEILAEDDEVAKFKLNVKDVKIIPSADVFKK